VADQAPRKPLIWRVSPVQTALLILVASPCAAVNLYAHPSSPVRLVTILIGVAALALAVVSRRMYLVVDDEGVAMRWVRAAHWMPWSDIGVVEIVSGVRGSDTIRFGRKDGSYLDAPPSLLQPSKPTGKPVARRMLRGTLATIESRRPAGG
jgi:uncharacterized membrane protein